MMNEYLTEKNLIQVLEYLYPNSNWIQDKSIEKETIEKRKPKNPKHSFVKRNFRPDYRNEELSMVVEFDGINHYQNSDVFWNDIDKINYYSELGYKFIQIPYFVQPTKEIIQHYFGVNLRNSLTTKSNGFNVENSRLNRSLPSSFSELGIRRFMTEYSSFPIETKKEILQTLYDNYNLTGLSMKVLPLSLIEFLDFKLIDEDKEYNSHFILNDYK